MKPVDIAMIIIADNILIKAYQIKGNVAKDCLQFVFVLTCQLHRLRRTEVFSNTFGFCCFFYHKVVPIDVLVYLEGSRVFIEYKKLTTVAGKRLS